MNTTVVWMAMALAAIATTGCQPDNLHARGFHLPKGDAESGRAAFVRLECTSCHAVEGCELPASANAKMMVMLGGEVRRVRTYGELVTAITDPAREVTREFPAQLMPLRSVSPMPQLNERMTVQQLADLVTFLETRYRMAPPPPAPVMTY